MLAPELLNLAFTDAGALGQYALEYLRTFPE